MEVTVVNFGNAQKIEVPEGATLSEALEEAGVDPASTIRFQGQTIDGEERQLVALTGGESIIAGAPEVSHG